VGTDALLLPLRPVIRDDFTPSFGDHELRVVILKVQRLTHCVTRKVNTVDTVGELPRQSYTLRSRSAILRLLSRLVFAHSDL